ncbi:Uncharacterised protein [Salmonella enterica subsp. enterica serovar Bovismorbificans]|uniref:Uncharacterized protein n=1 Tax=Salmonella enterica subsp. enterica serovar Bovismorbificans TaxID=58097 RepID=A0A655BQE2_SALET|nr:Uncharacterised protein [Salmonella enterica subsp. enterica serovar Bovismorbificans]CNU87633.1 Uncharacterised protein [Salmonella enterica subsp. enterica serovar Bovismorbificans]
MIARKPRNSTEPNTVTASVTMEIIIVFVSGDCPCAGSNPAIPAATPASSRPMTATIAPIAAGGNITSSQPVPAFLTMKETRQNNTPHIIKPPSATS